MKRRQKLPMASPDAVRAEIRALEILLHRFTPEEIERGAGSAFITAIEKKLAEIGEELPAEKKAKRQRWHAEMMEAQAARVKIRKGPDASRKSKREKRDRDYARYRRELLACLQHSSGPNPTATAVKSVAERNGVSRRTIRRATVKERQRITKEIQP